MPWNQIGQIVGPPGDAGTSITILAPVANAAALPTAGNNPGDTRLTEDNGHLHFWNGTAWTDAGQIRGPQGDTGGDGTSITLLPAVANAAALPASGNNVGDTRMTEDDGHLHSWNGTAWTDVGQIQGPPGATGAGATIGGSVATVADLPATGTVGVYQIVQADGNLYGWSD